MEQLQHFSHEHLLSLVELQSVHNNEECLLSLVELQPDHISEISNNEDEDGDEDDFVVENRHVGTCKMCKEEIYSFHLCYYSCKVCDYSLHKFCAQLPIIQQNHPLHPGHNLTLSEGFQYHVHVPTFSDDAGWTCVICKRRSRLYNYYCFVCDFKVDIICATMSEQKMNHPSHPHQLQRTFSRAMSLCCACGKEHSGTFYNCTTCSWFGIQLDCALLPSKLSIQKYTNDSFSHTHLLNIAYSFPLIEKKAKFYPRCRVCEDGFSTYQWHYRCNKCRYYVHFDCATSRREAFMSILMRASLGKTSKNFKDDDYPNLIHCPLPDESFNLLKHLFFNKDEFITKGKIDDTETFIHSCHQHPLILTDTLLHESVSVHDPMKRVELLCDGCVRPITDLPFYKCSEHHCGFVLHEWCSRLPSEILDHHDHPEHKLVLLPKIPKNSLGVFTCKICLLGCNGFSYGCVQCDYYLHINCGFIPDVITHEAHPNHLLLRFKASADSRRFCKACRYSMRKELGFYCPTCNFYIHTYCALLLPRTIQHKHDKHPLILRYYPAENYSGEYFCEICEEEFDPERWFYHCNMCASSMHTACAPLKLHFEHSTYTRYAYSLFVHLNVKFGGTFEIDDRPHPVTFAQGVNGQYIVCDKQLRYCQIYKCFSCKFARHIFCVRANPVIRNV
ncbi:uncharacterized protein LOC143609761 [Bidens hawaiensis]|uniref:uncharacterized protein LOC143609761 n=1 Tax=Bidens hawaiensis TaxID=980011 RepID=UPI00404944C9